MRFSKNSRIPAPAAVVLEALHLREPQFAGLRALTDAQWREALKFANRAQIKLPLRRCAREAMPSWVRELTDCNAANNLERLRRIQELYQTLDTQLRRTGIEYIALKGLTQCRLSGIEPADRVQYDIDLYTPPAQAAAARDAVIALGYEPLQSMEKFPTDHIPALIRKTGWEWRGDYFDPEIPLAVEIHFQFWNERTECLRAAGINGFWERRVVSDAGRAHIPALALVDTLGYSATHLLKHVLQGSAKPFHIYELARSLERYADDAAFWKQWRELHSPELRRLEAAMFLLAAEWFGCSISPAATEEIDRLPAATRAWFGSSSETPAVAMFHATKHELWLHLSLLDSRRDRLTVLRRRLLPTTMPGPIDAVHIPECELVWRRRALKQIRYAAYVAGRARHHAASLARLIASAPKFGVTRR